MNMRIKFLLALGFAMFLANIQAQNVEEALRYNSTFQIGSARNIAVGGAMGSIGADFSVLSTNPAGLARFKSTEFHMSPNIVFGNTSTNYLGNDVNESFAGFNISSAGVVIARSIGNSDWRNISIGFGLNRISSYNEDIFMSGTNTNASLLRIHANLANGTDTLDIAGAYPFNAAQSYGLGLINPDDDFNYSTIFDGVDPQQQITIQKSGGRYEPTVGASGNFKDKLYVGASFGIPIIRYNEKQVIRETNPSQDDDYFNFFEQESNVATTGIGVNFKLGVLGKPHKLVRVGAAFHAPSFIRMEDLFSARMLADDDAFLNETETVSGQFRYNLVSPWKVTTNAAVLLKQFGFITAEYEVQDHSRAKYKFKTDDAQIKLQEQQRNEEINNQLTWQHHVKLGAEFKLSVIRLRAGFQYKTSGLQNNDTNSLIYSGGLGYRGKHLFIDGAYSFTKASEIYEPYGLGNISSGVSNISKNNSQITFTVGYKL